MATASAPDQGGASPPLFLLPARCTKSIHFVRHGQGFHNVAGHINHDNYKDEAYFDAHLTEVGWRQAEQLGRHVSAVRLPVDLVVVSPLQRALETAVAAFGPQQQPHQPPAARHADGSCDGNGAADGGAAATAAATSGAAAAAPLMTEQDGLDGVRVARGAVWGAGCPPFIAQELCREHIGVHPCDRRNAVSEYRKRFPAIDFSLVAPEHDALWTASHREAKDEIRARGAAFLRWLAARPERSIAVVTHSSFLHFTLGAYGREACEGVQAELHRWYENCEMRSVVLSDPSGQTSVGGGHDPWHFAGGAHAAAH